MTRITWSDFWGKCWLPFVCLMIMGSVVVMVCTADQHLTGEVAQ